MISSHALDCEQPSSVESDFSEDSRVSEVQVWIGTQGHLAGASAAGAATTFLVVPDNIVRARVHAGAAILLKKISSDQLAIYPTHPCG